MLNDLLALSPGNPVKKGVQSVQRQKRRMQPQEASCVAPQARAAVRKVK